VALVGILRVLITLTVLLRWRSIGTVWCPTWLVRRWRCRSRISPLTTISLLRVSKVIALLILKKKNQ
jgi:hypothetical protein